MPQPRPDPRPADPRPALVPSAPPLNTPLVWIGGGALLTATLWLSSILAFLNALFGLFG